MKLKDVKLLIDDKLVTVTPELVADLFAEMYAGEQAQFFNHVGEIASTWKWGDMGMQLQYITEETGLNLKGRHVMQQIGEYSHWGMSCRLAEEVKEASQ